MSQNKLTALKKHYKQEGVRPRQKKAGGRKSNTKAFVPADMEAAVTFLQNFAEDRALVLPGRIPGFRRDDIKILPSSQTKKKVWDHYHLLMTMSERLVKKERKWAKKEAYICKPCPHLEVFGTFKPVKNH